MSQMISLRGCLPVFIYFAFFAIYWLIYCILIKSKHGRAQILQIPSDNILALIAFLIFDQKIYKWICGDKSEVAELCNM